MLDPIAALSIRSPSDAERRDPGIQPLELRSTGRGTPVPLFGWPTNLAAQLIEVQAAESGYRMWLFRALPRVIR